MLLLLRARVNFHILYLIIVLIKLWEMQLFGQLHSIFGDGHENDRDCDLVMRILFNKRIILGKSYQRMSHVDLDLTKEKKNCNFYGEIIRVK